MTEITLDIERDIGRHLLRRGLTLAVAESCTGGLIGHRVTSASGSSGYFLGGLIVYANSAKVALAGVTESALRRHGAVSAQVAGQLARGVRRRLGADIGLGVTGIAGPTGGTPRKPVGLVFIALATQRTCTVRRFRFQGSRLSVKNAACRAALRMVKEQFNP